MAYEAELEAGERLIRQFEIKVTKKVPPFYFAVSDQAVYWPGKKLIALKDPYYFHRIPHGRVQEVSIRRLSPYGWWLLAIVMVGIGAWSSLLVLEHALGKEPGTQRGSGWPFAILVGGLLLPFAARGRFGLRIVTSDKSFTWKPPLVVDSASKANIRASLDEILQACEQARLRVTDDREG